jgi:hypothetical protein
VVVVSSDIDDLAEFAGRYGVSYAQLRRANPWLRDTKLVTGKGKTYEIVIPDLAAERNYYQNLSKYTCYIHETTPDPYIRPAFGRMPGAPCRWFPTSRPGD